VNENWIELAIGIWILASPWLLGYSDVSLAKWSSLVCGVILIVLNSWIMFGETGEKEKNGAKEKPTTKVKEK